MKLPLTLLAAFCLAARAEPIKLQAGNTIEATLGKYTPGTIEVITAQGKMVVPIEQLDLKWRIEHLPLNPETLERRKLIKAQEDLVRALDEIVELRKENLRMSGVSVPASPETPKDDAANFRQLHEPAKEAARWVVGQPKSLRGGRCFYAALEPVDPVWNNCSLTVEADHGQLKVHVSFDCALSDRESTVAIAMAWDKEPVHAELWYLSKNHKEAFPVDESAFLLRAEKAQALIVSVKPPDRPSIALVFDLTGLPAMLAAGQSEFGKIEQLAKAP